MVEIELDRFEDLETSIKENIGDIQLLFRGQANSEWDLETTLERNVGSNISLEYYYQRACIALPQIEAYTGERWSIPNCNEYKEWIQKCQGDSIHFALEFLGYEFMAYLRHHGFPSPLLDWSRSPFVAAFFAFRNAKKGKVSIYAYSEKPQGFKTGQNGKALIRVLGPYTRSHKRHFQQQSFYTICTMLQPKDMNENSYYVKHESVFTETNNEQDALWKFNLPASEREKVLQHLNRYNLNAFSLFGSEDSLCETVAYNAFKKR